MKADPFEGVTPTINQAHAMIIEDEIQYLTSFTAMPDKSEPIAVHFNRNQGFHHGNPNYKGKKYEYHHFYGYTKDKCYKLIDCEVEEEINYS